MPKVTGHTNPPQKDKSQAKSSNTGGATAPNDAEGSGTSNSDSSSEGASAAGGGSGGDGGTGQGSPADGTKADGSQAGKQQSPATQPLNAESAADDSSSPLIPILLAIAALAAISIGAFVIRQRRRGPGTQVSPKAS